MHQKHLSISNVYNAVYVILSSITIEHDKPCSGSHVSYHKLNVVVDYALQHAVR